MMVTKNSDFSPFLFFIEFTKYKLREEEKEKKDQEQE